MSPLPARQILAQDTHRPWALPKRRWVMAQTWQKLLFAHWSLAPELLRPLIPESLELETYDGRAWIGIVPFLMNHVHLRGLPPVPGTRRFPELNVRTYVRHGEKRGVWFFSLDAANPLAVMVARSWFHLPYYRARMSISEDAQMVSYRSHRTHQGIATAAFVGSYQPTSSIFTSESGTLEHWLTERYCLYTEDNRGGLYRGDIQHAPWSLQEAEAEIEMNSKTEAFGITLPDEAPLLHYAESIDVLAWTIERVA